MSRDKVVFVLQLQDESEQDEKFVHHVRMDVLSELLDFFPVRHDGRRVVGVKLVELGGELAKGKGEEVRFCPSSVL